MLRTLQFLDSTLQLTCEYLQDAVIFCSQDFACIVFAGKQHHVWLIVVMSTDVFTDFQYGVGTISQTVERIMLLIYTSEIVLLMKSPR